MPYRSIANIKGNGLENPRIVGDDLVIDEVNPSVGTVTPRTAGNVRGPQGVQGNPGLEDVPTDPGIAALIATAGTSETQTAGDARWVQNGMLGALLNQRVPRVVDVPADMGMSMAIAIVRDENGEYSTNLDPAELHTPATGPTFYVDPVNGSNANTGLSWAQAFATAAYASQKNSREWGRIVLKGGIYDRTSALQSLAGPGSKAIVAAPGERVIFVTGDRITPWTSEGSGVYSGAIATCNGVLDAAFRDGHDVARPLRLAADETELAATPGTYTFASGTVKVHLLDGRAPDDDVFVSRPASTLVGPLEEGKSVYLEGVEWWGGTTANLTASGDNTALYGKRCGFHLSQSTNGLSVLGVSRVVLQDCGAHSNWLDGFNYHEQSGRTGEVVEVNCTADNNGMTSGSQNGSTAHESYRIVRAGGVYSSNLGANIADVNAAKSFNVGVTAANSRRETIPTDFLGGDMWLDQCTAGSAIAAEVQAGGTVRVRDLLRSGTVAGTTPW